MKYPAELTEAERALVDAELSARRTVLVQAFVNAREWERQSKQWESVVREQRETLQQYKAFCEIADRIIERDKTRTEEKAHYLEQIEKLTQALDEQGRQIGVFCATLDDLIACAGEDTPADVIAKCRAALGRVG